MNGGKSSKAIESLYGPVLGVCTRFSQREGINQCRANAKERHVACTWIDWEGNVHCTCVGCTKYRINVVGNLYRPHLWCSHAESVT